MTSPTGAPPGSGQSGIEQARTLVLWLADHCWEGMDVDGGDLQDKLEELGFAKRVPATEDFRAEWDADEMLVPSWPAAADTPPSTASAPAEAVTHEPGCEWWAMGGKCNCVHGEVTTLRALCVEMADALEEIRMAIAMGGWNSDGSNSTGGLTGHGCRATCKKLDAIAAVLRAHVPQGTEPGGEL